jgi:hypothetical protein
MSAINAIVVSYCSRQVLVIMLRADEALSASLEQQLGRCCTIACFCAG